jgi:hypothetical protein
VQLSDELVNRVASHDFEEPQIVTVRHEVSQCLAVFFHDFPRDVSSVRFFLYHFSEL